MNQGWIKLHRKILEWEWYTDTNTFALFMHLLLTCNFKSTKWRGIKLEPGETIKGIRTLSEETTLSLQNVRTAISKLKSTGELTQRQHGKHRILKLKSYTKYQLANTESNSELTAYQHDANKELTHDKERKKEKNVKKVKKDKYGTEFQNVFLLGEEYKKLVERFGEDSTKNRIESLSGYVASTGKKYKSHYATILSWAKSDVAESKPIIF